MIWVDQSPVECWFNSRSVKRVTQQLGLSALLSTFVVYALVVPFLVRKESIYTTWRNIRVPVEHSVDGTHTIDDDEMWLRMHPQLDGTFLYFPYRSLTLDGQGRRDEFPVVYLTPWQWRWYIIVMVELLVIRRESDNSNSADMSEMYARPSTWDVSAYYFMPSFWIDDNLYIDEPLADDDILTQLTRMESGQS